jgi:hypothetical protein
VDETINSKNTITRGGSRTETYNRKRTNSLDSEKENQPLEPPYSPIENVITDHAHLKVVADKTIVQAVRIEDVQDPSIITKGPPITESSPSVVTKGSQSEKPELTISGEKDLRSKVVDSEVIHSRSYTNDPDSGLITGDDTISRSKVSGVDLMKKVIDSDESLVVMREDADKELMDDHVYVDEEEAELDNVRCQRYFKLNSF